MNWCTSFVEVHATPPNMELKAKDVLTIRRPSVWKHGSMDWQITDYNMKVDLNCAYQLHLFYAWTVTSVNRLVKNPKHMTAITSPSKPGLYPFALNQEC